MPNRKIIYVPTCTSPTTRSGPADQDTEKQKINKANQDTKNIRGDDTTRFPVLIGMWDTAKTR